MRFWLLLSILIFICGCNNVSITMKTQIAKSLCGSYSQTTTLPGAGTKASPYRISNPYQLNAIGDQASLMSSYFILTNNISMSCLNAPHLPIGSINSRFEGNFDGNGYAIDDWTYENSSEDNVGLFRVIRGASIYNLSLRNVRIAGANYVGGITASNTEGYINNVHVSGSVSGTDNTGGIVGFITLGAIDSSSSSVTISGGTNVGGVIGVATNTRGSGLSFSGTISATADTVGGIIASGSDTTLFNIISTGNVSSSGNYVGGIMGKPVYNLTNAYSSGTVSGLQFVGGIAGNTTRMNNVFSTASVSGLGSNINVGVLVGDSSKTTTNSFYLDTAVCDADSATAGIQACNTVSNGSYADITDFYDLSNEPLHSWDFASLTTDGRDDIWISQTNAFPTLWQKGSSFVPPFTGQGTASNPYLISSPDDFNLIGSNPRYLGAVFRLTQNLDFTARTFIPISQNGYSFYGELLGDHHTISNFTIPLGSAGSDHYHGMIYSSFKPSEVRDISVTSASVTANLFGGGIAGLSSGNFFNVSYNGTITTGYHGGAIIGLLGKTGLVSHAQVNATVSGTSYLGVMVGNLRGTIRYSSSRGSITGTSRIGGITGFLSGLISDSSSSASVTLSGNQGGGIAGSMDSGVIERVFSTSNVSGRPGLGGLVGQVTNSGTISQSFHVGTITHTSSPSNAGIGRLVGSGPVTFSEIYFADTSVCDSSSGAGIQLCNTNGTGSKTSYTDFFLSTETPLSTWDFSNIWLEQTNDYPILRP